MIDPKNYPGKLKIFLVEVEELALGAMPAVWSRKSIYFSPSFVNHTKEAKSHHERKNRARPCRTGPSLTKAVRPDFLLRSWTPSPRAMNIVGACIRFQLFSK